MDAYLKDETGCFPTLFKAVEELVTSGGPEERELVLVGFLEDLQGAIGWAGHKEAAFRGWLGPNTLTEWEALLRLWEEIGPEEGVRRTAAGSIRNWDPGH